MVYWNEEWEVYEHVHEEGYIQIFRDDVEAKKFADENNLVFSN